MPAALNYRNVLLTEKQNKTKTCKPAGTAAISSITCSRSMWKSFDLWCLFSQSERDQTNLHKRRWLWEKIGTDADLATVLSELDIFSLNEEQSYSNELDASPDWLIINVKNHWTSHPPSILERASTFQTFGGSCYTYMWHILPSNRDLRQTPEHKCVPSWILFYLFC